MARKSVKKTNTAAEVGSKCELRVLVPDFYGLKKGEIREFVLNEYLLNEIEEKRLEIV